MYKKERVGEQKRYTVRKAAVSARTSKAGQRGDGYWGEGIRACERLA